MKHFYSREFLGEKQFEKIKIWDWLLFAFFAIGCFLLFSHADIETTAEHSFAYLNGNLLDFYTGCHEMNNGYGANYMPSTFIAFALWNLPIKLLGLAPQGWLTSSLGLMYWYRLLPVTVYLICGFLTYKLARRLDFSFTKAKIVAYVFLTAPLGIYSQFIFSQYDIFTVFFMLLGIYYYFKEAPTKKDYFFFALYFGISATFKYYSILIFAVLLLMRVKNVWKILLTLPIVGFPYILEYLVYIIFDKENFTKNVFGFFALSYANNGEINIGFSAIRLFPLVLCCIIAWSFFAHPKDRQEEIAYAFFFCSGICFALFSLMTWHPQWLLFGTIFWTFSSCLSKRFDIFMLLDSLFILLFYMFVSHAFFGNCDQKLLEWGIFRNQLIDRDLSASLTMADIYHIDSSNLNLIFTVMVAILLVGFIFKHPRFCQKDFQEPLTQLWSVRVRLLAGGLLFAVPALLCLPSMLAQPKIVWDNQIGSGNAIVENLEDDPAVQYISPRSDTIGVIEVRTATYDQTLKDAQLLVSVTNPENNEVLGKASVQGEDISNNGITSVVFKSPVKVIPQKRYALTFEIQTPDIENENIALYYYKPLTVAQWEDELEKKKFDTDYMEIYGKPKRTGLDMRILSSEFPKTQESVEEDSSKEEKQTNRELEKEWEEDWVVTQQEDKEGTGAVSPFN